MGGGADGAGRAYGADRAGRAYGADGQACRWDRWRVCWVEVAARRRRGLSAAGQRAERSPPGRALGERPRKRPGACDNTPRGDVMDAFPARREGSQPARYGTHRPVGLVGLAGLMGLVGKAPMGLAGLMGLVGKAADEAVGPAGGTGGGLWVEVAARRRRGLSAAGRRTERSPPGRALGERPRKRPGACDNTPRGDVMDAFPARREGGRHAPARFRSWGWWGRWGLWGLWVPLRGGSCPPPPRTGRCPGQSPPRAERQAPPGRAPGERPRRRPGACDHTPCRDVMGASQRAVVC